MSHNDPRYVKLSSTRIVKTVAYTDEINVDIDENRNIVGIELLNPRAYYNLEIIKQHIQHTHYKEATKP